MRIAVFSTKPYDRRFLLAAAGDAHDVVFFEPRLAPETAPLAKGFGAVCAFVNDDLCQGVIRTLADCGVGLIALRCAGFNQVDLQAAADAGVKVARVPAYSPYAVAEHTAGLILSLNRKLHKAYNRVREGNFALEGLLGFDLHGRCAGVIGTGKIGAAVARILHGFGCRVLLFDPYQNAECEKYGEFVSLDELVSQSDIITLHCPLSPQTHHLINENTLKQMQRGVMLINTSRGALVDTPAVITALKNGVIGSLGIDVYEEEADLFFEDMSGKVIQDDVFSRLLTFPNVLITGHQAFFTQNALEAIAKVTMENVTAFENGEALLNEIKMQ